MPELPEVETVMRGLSSVLVGRSIASVELRRAGLRFPFPRGFAAGLKGRQVVGLQRRAKYILVNLDDGHCLLVHLGMTGRFTVLDENARPNNLGEFYFKQGAGGAGSSSIMACRLSTPITAASASWTCSMKMKCQATSF